MVWHQESGQLDFGGWREEIEASSDPLLEPQGSWTQGQCRMVIGMPRAAVSS